MDLLMKKVGAPDCDTDTELRNILRTGGVLMMTRSLTMRLETEPAVNCFRLLKCLSSCINY